MTESADRRRYRRVQAPVLVRPTSALARDHLHQLKDISQGGLRAFTDETYRVGQRLELELFLPDLTSLTVVVAVAWIQELPAGSAAHFEVGMCYVEMIDADLQRIAQVLGDD